MSDHRVEDLVEETLVALLASGRSDAEKRLLARDLFRFQGLFDTSDTYGRVRRLLEGIGYDPESAPSGRPVLEIVADALSMADAMDERSLVHDWLALLVDGIDGGTLIDDSLPEDFPAFQARPAAIALRALAVRHLCRGWRGVKGAIPLRSWSALAADYDRLRPDTRDRRSMLRFLLDRKTPEDRIVADYERDKAKGALPDGGALQQLPDMLSRFGDFALVAQQSDGNERIFAFEIGRAAADPDAARFHWLIRHDRDLQCLYPSFGVRVGMIERWQGRGFRPDEADMHFETSLIAFAPEERLQADKGLGAFGWKWRLDQSAKLLEKRLETIVGYWPCAADIQAFYTRPLSRLIDEEGYDGMAKALLPRREAYGFFANEVDLLFACACRAWDCGEKPVREREAIADWLAHIRPDARGDRVDCLKRLESGPAFPAKMGRWKLRRFEERFPLTP